MHIKVAAEHDVLDLPLFFASPGFVGREQETETLTQVLAGAPAVVLVEGEAGIGKTRLLQEYLSSPAGREHRPLLACCPPFQAPSTLGPVIDAVRQAVGDVRELGLSDLAGVLRPLFPEWASALPAAPEPAADAATARHRLFRALGELLGQLRVSVLVAEDVHWADEATLEFLVYLASVRPRQVSLLLTCRPEELAEGSALRGLSRLAAGGSGLRLTLGLLGVTATAALVSSMLGGAPVSDDFATFVHERTDGLPLAVEESVRLLGTRSDLARRGGRLVRRALGRIVVPPTIRDTVLERAARLSADERAVLEAAAVLAVPAEESMLAAVSGLSLSRAGTGLCGGLASGLLVEDGLGRPGRVMFRHVLAAQAVHEAIPVPRRKAAHLRAARALEGRSPAPVAQLVRHFREAGRAAQWCRYAEQAAGLAEETGDEKTAAALLHDVLTHADLPAGSRLRLARKISHSALDSYALLDELTRALRSLRDHPALAPEQRAEVDYQLGRVLMGMGEYQQGSAELERAIPGLGHEPVLVAKAMTILGWPLWTLQPAAAHLRWLDRAATVVADAPTRVTDRLQLAVNAATALLQMGEEAGWALAASLCEDAGTPRHSLHMVSGYLNTGDSAMRWGRYEEARRRLTITLRMATDLQHARLRDWALVTLAHLDWLTGAWTDLAGRAEVLGELGELDQRSRLEALLVAGLLNAVTGAGEDGKQQLRQVIGEGLERGIVDVPLEPAAALARLSLFEGRPGDAVELTDEPMRVIARKGVWLWATETAPVRVQALAECGRTDDVAKLVEAFATGLRGRDLSAPRAALATCRAILASARGHDERAAGLFGRAADAWTALPRPYAALLTRERQARSLLSAGAGDRGLPLLSDVLCGLTSLGATRDADRVASSLREHGIAVPRGWRGGQRGYGGRLSPREIEVVRLVAAGHTNQQIARVLCRSAKTVDTQLTSAMRKFGVRTRTALAVQAITAGVASHDEPFAAEQSPAAR